MKRLDEAVERTQSIIDDVPPTAGLTDKLDANALHLILRALSLYRAEAMAWRKWTSDEADWAGAGEELHNARAATEAFEREDK